ncbi:hypothetical protein AAY473_016822, partial [Plecturocebus cupreus]
MIWSESGHPSPTPSGAASLPLAAGLSSFTELLRQAFHRNAAVKWSERAGRLRCTPSSPNPIPIRIWMEVRSDSERVVQPFTDPSALSSVFQRNVLTGHKLFVCDCKTFRGARFHPVSLWKRLISPVPSPDTTVVAKKRGTKQEHDHFGRLRQADHLRLGVLDQTDRHGETLSLLKVQKLARLGGTC